MDTTQLKTFIECAKQLSFSRASEQMHISQSAISKRIASLESELGRRLFDRLGRDIRLTEAGVTLLPHARDALMMLENSINALRNMNAQVAGPLHVATSHHIAGKRLPAVLKQYRRRYPEVELHLQFMASETACQAVIDGDVELAVLTLPPRLDSELRHWTIWSDPMQLVISRDHPLLQTQPTPSVEELIREVPALLPDSSTFTRQIIDQALRPYPIRIAQCANFLDTLHMLVDIGMGWSVLPRSMLGPSLLAIDAADAPIVRHLGILCNEKRSLSNAGLRFIDLLVENAELDQTKPVATPPFDKLIPD